MAQFRHRYGAHAAGQHSYLDYMRMKDFLHAHEDDENEALLTEDTPNSDSNIATFWDVFVEEINRVDTSFQISLLDIQELLNDFQVLASSFNADTDREKKLKKIQETFLKRIATVLHDKIAKLEDFRLINRTAAIKILKKFDKNATRNGGQPFYDIYLGRMDRLEFGHGNSLVDAKRGLVELYAACFCDGEQEEAHLKLSLSKAAISEEVKRRVALKMGVVAALFAWLVNDCIVSPHLSMIYLLGSDPSVYVYAAVGALITYRWFWGFSVYMWDSVGVDYMLVLSLDPTKHLPNCADIFSDAADLSILYLLNVLIFHILRFHYIHIDRLDEPSSVQYACQYAYVMPVLLVIGTVVRAVGSFAQPISYGVFSTRIASRLARTPFMKVFLRDNFAANILTSFTKVWSATLYGGCYFVTGAYLYSADPSSAEGAARFELCTTSGKLEIAQIVLHLLPLVIRFLQCLRQLRDYHVAPKSQPPRNTTVDYTQQTSLDPGQLDPAIEFGYTWYNPLFLELDVSHCGVEEDDEGDDDLEGEDGRDAELGPRDTVGVQQLVAVSGRELLCLSEGKDKDRGSRESRAPSPVKLRRFTSLGSSSPPSSPLRGVNSGKAAFNPLHRKNSQEEEDSAEAVARKSTSWTWRDVFTPTKTNPPSTQHNAEVSATSYNPLVGDRTPTTSAKQSSAVEMTSLSNAKFGAPRSSVPARGVVTAAMTRGRSLSDSDRARAVVQWALPPLQRVLCVVGHHLYAVHKAVWVWPHSFNALRYFLNIVVVVFGAFPPSDPAGLAYMVWFTALYVVSTIYTSWWDVYVDYQLLQFDSDKPFLRKKLFYEETEWFYYFVIIANPILRFFWTLSFTPYGAHPFFVVFEIARRSFWAVLRMEVAYIQELNRRRAAH